MSNVISLSEYKKEKESFGADCKACNLSGTSNPLCPKCSKRISDLGKMLDEKDIAEGRYPWLT